MSTGRVRGGKTVAVAMVMLIAMVGTPSAIASPQPSPTRSTTREIRDPGPAATWFDDDLMTVQRIDAGDPTAAAIAVSRERFADDEAEVVVVSRRRVRRLARPPVFATRGPILLTDSATLDGRVAAEVTSPSARRDRLPVGRPGSTVLNDRAAAARLQPSGPSHGR